jgi:hypothetical protein
MISLYSSTSFPTAEKKKNREVDIKENKRGSFQLTGRLSFFPFDFMAELDWPASVVMREHLQNLVSQGYMIAAELATCHVPASPAPVAGYIVACSAFYMREFSVPSHRFLHPLL